MGFSTEPIEKIDWFQRYEIPLCWNQQPSNSDALNGLSKTPSNRKKLLEGFAVGLFVRYRCVHGRIHGVPMNTLVCEYTNTVYQVSLVAGFGRGNMVMDYPQSRTDKTSSQSVVVLSMLIVILLTGRAIYVAISTDATLKGIFILIVYSSTLIFVGFIAGVNASNIRSRKKREISFSSNLEPSQTDVDFNPNLAQYNSTERFIIEFLLRHDGQCWQSNIVKESSMTNSKISRTLSKLESQGILTRVRDGMGKRVNLHKDELI